MSGDDQNNGGSSPLFWMLALGAGAFFLMKKEGGGKSSSSRVSGGSSTQGVLKAPKQKMTRKQAYDHVKREFASGRAPSKELHSAARSAGLTFEDFGRAERGASFKSTRETR